MQTCTLSAEQKASWTDSMGDLQGWMEEDVVSKGVWHLLADGTCMWSLALVTRGAYSHVVVFR